jgi:2-oxoglutarate ferredoxin oxidoreductase subunit gamma
MSGERVKIRIAGSGGQGVILAAIVLAEAAGIYDDRFVAQTQSYGPEARGGNCKAEVVISNEEIDYPKAKNLDILMALNQASLDEYFHDLKPDGVLIVNSDHCARAPVSTAYSVPMSTLAREKAGAPQVMNVLAVGVLAAVTGIVSVSSVRKAVAARAPKGTGELNLKAVNIGLKEGKKAAEKIKRRPPEKFSRLLKE